MLFRAQLTKALRRTRDERAARRTPYLDLNEDGPSARVAPVPLGRIGIFTGGPTFPVIFGGPAIRARLCMRRRCPAERVTAKCTSVKYLGRTRCRLARGLGRGEGGGEHVFRPRVQGAGGNLRRLTPVVDVSIKIARRGALHLRGALFKK